MHLAALQGHTSLVEWLATSCGVEVTTMTSEGMAPLHFAALGGSTDTIEWIARAATSAANGGAPEPALPSDEDGLEGLSSQPPLTPVLAAPTGAGLTLMHLACMKGHLGLAQWLAGHGLDASASDPKARTPLHLAVVGLHADTVAWLVEAGANPKAPDADGKTPLQLAQAKASTADAGASATAGRVLELLQAAVAPPPAPASAPELLTAELSSSIAADERSAADLEGDDGDHDHGEASSSTGAHPASLPPPGCGATSTSVFLTWEALTGLPEGARRVGEYSLQACSKPLGGGSGLSSAVGGGWSAWRDVQLAAPVRDQDGTDGAGDEPVPSTAATYACVVGLSPGTIFSFRLRARNTNGWGAFGPKSHEVATLPAPSSGGDGTAGVSLVSDDSASSPAASASAPSLQTPNKRRAWMEAAAAAAAETAASSAGGEDADGNGEDEEEVGEGAPPAAAAPSTPAPPKPAEPVLPQAAIEAAERGDVGALETLLAAMGTGVHAPTAPAADGAAATEFGAGAVTGPQESLVARDATHGRSLLHVAAMTGKVAVIHWILGVSSQPAAPPAAAAATAGPSDAPAPAVTPAPVPRLPISLESEDRLGATPLLLAVLGGHLPALKALAAAGASINAADGKGYSGLHYAGLKGKMHLNVFRWLCEAGADPLAKHARGGSVRDTLEQRLRTVRERIEREVTKERERRAAGGGPPPPEAAAAVTRDKDELQAVTTMLGLLDNALSLPAAPPTPVFLDSSSSALLMALPFHKWPPGCAVPSVYEVQVSKRVLGFYRTLTDVHPSGLDMHAPEYLV